jgi:hypothetical protein
MLILPLLLLEVSHAFSAWPFSFLSNSLSLLQ